MCNAVVSFKWLDILEKEFDKAFVNIDLLASRFLSGEFDGDETEIIYTIRKKLETMCSCFSQLSHKAMTIFQVNAKVEAELINLKSEIVEMKTRKELLEKQVHSLLAQLHSKQLQLQQQQQSGMQCGRPRRKQQVVEAENTDTDTEHTLRGNSAAAFSPQKSAGVNVDTYLVYGGGGSDDDVEKAIVTLKNWKSRLHAENELLRCSIVNLQAEVCGARLAAKYLDKELAGRIQQLQLLSREGMRNEVKNKLWNQLDAEILLQRHKTVIKVMRQQRNGSLASSPPPPPDNVAGRVRNVYLTREPNKGLGISVTGGREHSLPIIISELEPWCARRGLYVGDAILSVNNIDLNTLTHSEAVKILSDQMGSVTLTVITLSEAAINLDEIQEEINSPASYYSYPFHRDLGHSLGQREHCCSSNAETAATAAVHTSAGIPFQFQHQRCNVQPPAICNLLNSCKDGRADSKTELLGITTLQKIFRTISAIDSTSNERGSDSAANQQNTSNPASDGNKDNDNDDHHHRDGNRSSAHIFAIANTKTSESDHATSAQSSKITLTRGKADAMNVNVELDIDIAQKHVLVGGGRHRNYLQDCGDAAVLVHNNNVVVCKNVRSNTQGHGSGSGGDNRDINSSPVAVDSMSISNSVTNVKLHCDPIAVSASGINNSNIGTPI